MQFQIYADNYLIIFEDIQNISYNYLIIFEDI